MTKVLSAFGLKEVITFNTREEAEKWLGQQASIYNYGICRMWSENGYDYFDIGPRVFCIKKSDE